MEEGGTTPPPPGTLIHLGEQKETPVKVSLLAFAGDGCEEQVATNPDEFSLLENDAMVGVLR